MMTDPIADMLTRMRNAIMMHHEQVSMPHSKMKEKILSVLKEEGFIRKYEVLGDKVKKTIVVGLKYSDGESAIVTLNRVSTPSRRIYMDTESLKPFRSGMGIRVVTTSKGIVSDNQARKQKIGGEVLLEIW